MYPAPSYSSVSHIWSSWNRLLKSPREALLGAYFPNLVEAALADDNLKKHATNGTGIARSKDTFERRILQYLENCFANDDPVIPILRLEHSSALADLERHLKQDPLDVSAIYQKLSQLQGAPSPELLQRELAAEPCRGDSADGPRLRVLTWLLFRKGLDKHSVRKMKNLPRDAMTRAGSRVVLERHLDSLACDSTIGRQAAELLRESAEHAAASTRLEEHFDVCPEAMRQVFTVPQWRLVTYHVLEYAADLWKAEVLRQSSLAPRGDPVASLLGDRPALDNLAEALGYRLVCEVFRSALAVSTGELHATPGSTLQTLGHSISDVLISEGAFADNGPVFRGLPEEGVRNLASQAFAGSAARELANEVCKVYWQQDRSHMLDGVAYRATELLAEEADSRAIRWEGATEDDVERLCRAWASRRELDLELGGLFGPLIAHAADFLYRYQRPDYSVPQGLWERWAWWFSKRSNFHRVVPWHTLSTAEFDRVLDGLFEAVLGEEDEWRAVFRVSGLDSQGVSWSAGNVTFYDPYVYDYGEGWALPHDPQAFSESFARVVVRAETEESARQAVLGELEGTLDMLSFALSVNRKKFGGFRPELGRSSWVYRPSQETGLAGAETPKAESPAVQRAVEDELEKLAGDYEHLLRLSAGASAGATELQQDFLRAAHWYRKGQIGRAHV